MNSGEAAERFAPFPGRRRHVLVWVFAVATALLGARCGPPRSLSPTFRSQDDLIRAVLDGFAHRDRSGLEAIALSEAEFRDLVWPQLPAARPERNLPWEYVWKDIRQKSRSTLGQLLTVHGGRRYKVLAVQATGDTTRYHGFEVARKTELTVADQTGQQRRIRLFGSIVNARGRFKVFSYITD